MRQTERFEEHRDHLRAVAVRMVGSRAEAEDVVQETWLRYARSDTAAVTNLGGWLTRVAGRLCLDHLRARASRREEPLLDHDGAVGGAGPEDAAVTADAVGPALLVVLDTLAPAERVAFVLHDVFAVPFEEIAPVLETSTANARQLASRGRRRVRDTEVRADDPARSRPVVAAFLAAAQGGDLAGLLAAGPGGRAAGGRGRGRVRCAGAVPRAGRGRRHGRRTGAGGAGRDAGRAARAALGAGRGAAGGVPVHRGGGVVVAVDTTADLTGVAVGP